MCAQADDAPARALAATFVKELIEVKPGEGKFPPALRAGNKETLMPKERFRMAKYEVPQNLYEVVVNKNPSRWKGPRNSVEMVSFDEAVQFCESLTNLLRNEALIGPDEAVRLPTELEWEYACRAGTATNYSFGDDPKELGAFGWFDGNAKGNDPPVGAKRPNPWGFYDVHGYLWEWCAPSKTTTELSAKEAIARGGAWTSSAKECESASRKAFPREHRAPDVGFRCVVAPTKLNSAK